MFSTKIAKALNWLFLGHHLWDLYEIVSVAYLEWPSTLCVKLSQAGTRLAHPAYLCKFIALTYNILRKIKLKNIKNYVKRSMFLFFFKRLLPFIQFKFNFTQVILMIWPLPKLLKRLYLVKSFIGIYIVQDNLLR